MYGFMYVCKYVCMRGFQYLCVGKFLLYFTFSYILTLNLQVFRAVLKINYHYCYNYYYITYI